MPSANTVLTLTLLAVFCVGRASADENDSTSSGNVTANAVRYYWAGNIIDATTDLTNIASGSGSVDEKINARLFLAQICAEIQDFACLDKNNVALLDLQKTITDTKKAALSWEQINPSFIREFVWMPQFGNQNISNNLDTMNHVPVGLIEPDKYLLLQSSGFGYFAINQNFVNARTSVSRMIARAVALNTNDYTIPLYLEEIVQDLFAIGDGARALLIVQRLDNFIRSSLPKNNPTHIHYLEATAGLAASFGNAEAVSDGLSRLDAAELQVEHLQISDEWKSNEITKIHIQRAMLLFLENKLENAIASLNNSPLEKRRGQIQTSGQFSSNTEFTFAILDLFLSKATSHPIDQNWKALLSKRPAWEWGSKLDQFFEVEREFGLALANADDGKLFDDQMLEKSALDEVRLFENSLFARAHTFPVPDVVSRLIIGLELENLSRKSALNETERDFVVRATDILQRSFLHGRGDELYLMSGLRSEKERRLAHTWLLLSDRRNELEIQGLVSAAEAAWIKRGGKKDEAPPQTGDEGSPSRLRASLVELDRQIEQLPDAFEDSDRATPQSIELPSSGLLESTLSANEAVVSEAVFMGKAYKVCIGPHHQFAFTSSQVEPTLITDLKLLRASLTASYPPSDALDAQYPAQAALHLRNFILGGLGSCVEQAQRIIYNPIVDLADIPLPALLDEIPPHLGEGYDLAHAAWLLNKYQFSYVSSVEEFVAARRLASTSGAEFPFLGIGDPELNQPLTDGKTGGQLLASRGAPSVNGPISSLPDLPATGEELHQVASTMSGAKLLLKGDATESEFLREPLGHYNIVEFATHGLVTGDLQGISEPGLVLTPTSETDTAAATDGFLSSTKLATFALRARLVVLSACNTANFEVDRFVGSIRGLTSALGESGVPTVIASLWPVESDTSKTIMTNFFYQLQHGNDGSVSGAFAEATRSFIRSTKRVAFMHPRFWAPFVVYGDGGESVASPYLSTAPHLAQFSASAEPGEINTLVRSDQSKSLYDSGYGAWTGSRFSSQVEKRLPTGGVEWSVKDAAIGAGRIAISKSRLFVAGYLSTENRMHTVPLIRALDFNGHLLWQHNIDEGQSLAFVTDIATAPSGAVWVLTQSANNFGTQDYTSFLHVLNLDEKGNVLGSWKIPTSKESVNIQPPVLAIASHGVYVFLTTTSDAGRWTTDDFGQQEVCEADDGTKLFRIDSGSPDPLALGLLPAVVVVRAKRINNQVYIAGSKHQNCEDNGEPLFGQLKEMPNGKMKSNSSSAAIISEIYVEHGFLGGQFVEFSANKGGVILSGSLTSRTKELLPTDFSKIKYSSYSGLEYQRNDGFLVELNLKQPIKSAKLHFIDSGASVFLNGMVANDNDVLLAGSVGSHTLWARYDLR